MPAAMLQLDIRKVVAVATLAALAGLVPAGAARADLPPNLRPTFVLAQNEEPPPISSDDFADEERRAKIEEEKRRKKELDELPAYKRWWFWALTAAVVGTAVVVGVVIAKPKTQPAMACMTGNIGCFGDGR
jgi:hypothetical protein